MNDLVWPAVVCVVAVLAFLRFRPAAPSVSVKRVRQLEKKLKRAEADREAERARLLEESKKQAKAYAEELNLIKGQVQDRLNAFAEDMTLLKQEFSSIKTKAGFKAVVERQAG